MNQKKLIEWIVAVLIILFLYTGGTKVLDHALFRIQLFRQPLPKWVLSILIWALPVMELAAAGLLAFARTRMVGLWLSVVLMIGFSGYTALAFTGAFGYIPCACGRIFSGMGWGGHLAINLIFLFLSIAATWMFKYKSRAIMDTS